MILFTICTLICVFTTCNCRPNNNLDEDSREFYDKLDSQRVNTEKNEELSNANEYVKRLSKRFTEHDEPVGNNKQINVEIVPVNDDNKNANNAGIIQPDVNNGDDLELASDTQQLSYATGNQIKRSRKSINSALSNDDFNTLYFDDNDLTSNTHKIFLPIYVYKTSIVERRRQRRAAEDYDEKINEGDAVNVVNTEDHLEPTDVTEILYVTPDEDNEIMEENESSIIVHPLFSYRYRAYIRKRNKERRRQ